MRPIVNHVFDPKHANMLPMAWSNGGKKLLHEIIGNELPPFDVTGNTFQETCSGSVVSDLQEEAWQTVVRRAWDPDTLVPIFDMFNHRNGKWHNLDSTKVSSGEDVVVFASRNVEKGEQLYLSYNECADCIGYAWTYVLPDILKDYMALWNSIRDVGILRNVHLNWMRTKILARLRLHFLQEILSIMLSSL